MTTNHTLFDFNGAPLRVVDVEGVPYFVAADVCKALTIANARDALQIVGSTDKMAVKLTKGVGRKANTVTEAGLYELVMQSRKPEAHRQPKPHVPVKARSAIP
jgi:prophage antirepressor-like protein